MEMTEVKGVTYSVEHYQEFEQTGDLNYFEEIIDMMILDGISGMNDSIRNAIRGLSKDEKRMAILSLLDKDLNLFKRIKALTDKNIGKMDHIKDIILMLREYVKVGEVEKKKFGEVMTPLELVKEMLATLPEEVWSNPNLKWLDPANGTGPYPIMVIYKLMKGLESWEPDAEKRYKHIVENMIYVCELQPKNMFLYMCAVDPFDTYKLNIYTGSFLEPEFDKHMKDVWCIENFDICIGNPPYNSDFKKNLYIDFFERFFSFRSKNGYLTFVTPSRYVIQPEYNSFRDQVEKISSNVILKNTGRIFGDKASFSTVYTTIFFGSEDCSVDWVSGFDDPIVRKVLNKTGDKLLTIRSKSILKNKEERDSFDDEKKEDHFLYFVNAKGKCDTPYRYLPYKKEETFVKKVYLTEFVGTGNKKTLGKIYVDKKGDIGLGTDSCMYIKSDSDERLDSLKFFLSSNTIDYVINTICQSSHVNQTMKLIVDPTLYIDVKKNEDIYTFFEFTESEISIIESYK
jgi:hypothetical protein